ncbi:MAG: MBL fold metallo-hydrolase [Pseudomonadota bacterium]
MNTRTHSLKIGDIEVTVLNDGQLSLPTGFFSNLPDAVAAGLGDHLTVGASLWLVCSGDQRILIDTGSAEALKQMFPESGKAWSSLSGESPTDIVLTHMHADHIGGLSDPAAFPGVKIHVARAEWKFWTQEGLADAMPEDMRPMIAMIQQVAMGIADRIVLHDGETELAQGMHLIDLPGHTPGH